MPVQPLYDISIIKDILPHRSPFLFVERVTRLEVGQRIIAEKDLSLNECFFEGHFPRKPIMPGVLLSEALVQTSGLLLGLTWKARNKFMNRKRPDFLFLANISMKFSIPAEPGDTLGLESRLKKKFGRLFFFEVEAYVGSNQIASGSLILAQEE